MSGSMSSGTMRLQLGKRGVTPFGSCQGGKPFRVVRPVRASAVSQHHSHAPDTAAAYPRATSSRRELVAGVAALTVLLPGAATAAATCDFISSPSGLQYCDIKQGEGPEPVKGALIRCHYTGRLASNNRVFDSSYERGRPLTFKIGVHEVISGWDLGILGTEGVPSMKQGGKRVLLIPSALGYGPRGAGGLIPPNSDLLFEVELLGKQGRR